MSLNICLSYLICQLDYYVRLLQYKHLMKILFGLSIRASVVLIRAQCSTPSFFKTNTLTFFRSLLKTLTELSNSTLPSPQGVYTPMLILYNFCILNT